MGNRAIVKPINSDVGVYLHWNGGIDSVTAFLKYCKLRRFRDFGGEKSDGYGIARFCQIVGNYFGGSLSLGIETNIRENESEAECLDNGIYVIDGWDIAYRIGGVQESEGYDVEKMMVDIDAAQPPNDQLGKDYILAKEVDASELQIMDMIYDFDSSGHVVKRRVTNVIYDFNGNSIPYIDLYLNGVENINNRLIGKYRIVNDDDDE